MNKIKLKALAIASLILAVSGSLYALNLKKIKHVESIEPPIPELAPSYSIFNIDASLDNTISTSEGTKIHLAANSLTDSLGNVIEGEVAIYYREFNDPGNIFLSGIPMESKDKMMSSGGMFDIKAMQGNKTLELKMGSEIKVSMLSEVDSLAYPVWLFNEKTGEWVSAGTKTSCVPNPDLEDLKKAKDELKSVFEVPLGPNYFCFNYMGIIDVHYGAYNSKASVVVQEKISAYGFNFSQFSVNIGINYYKSTVPADLMLWKNLSQQKIPNNAQDFGASLKEINKKQNVYQLNIFYYQDTLYSGQIQAVMPLQHLYRYSPELWKDKYQSYLQEMDSFQKAIENTADFVASASIEDFGIYNFDYLIKKKEAKAYAANFTLDKDAFINEVFYMVKGKNILARYPSSTWNSFRILNEPDDVIITVLANRKLACYFPTEADYNNSESTHTFQLHDSGIVVNSKDDINKIFELERGLEAVMALK